LRRMLDTHIVWMMLEMMLATHTECWRMLDTHIVTQIVNDQTRPAFVKVAPVIFFDTFAFTIITVKSRQ
jgi:hypothetical protein